MKEEDIIKNRIPCDGLDTGCSGRRGCGTPGCKRNYTEKFDADKKMQELKKQSWISNVKRVYRITVEQATEAYERIHRYPKK